jgi:hypothetical protein
LLTRVNIYFEISKKRYRSLLGGKVLGGRPRVGWQRLAWCFWLVVPHDGGASASSEHVAAVGTRSGGR